MVREHGRIKLGLNSTRRSLRRSQFFLLEACGTENSKNAPHLESAITLGVFVQMFATANCSGGTPKKVSNNILLDPSRKTIFRSTGEIGVSNELH